MSENSRGRSKRTEVELVAKHLNVPITGKLYDAIRFEARRQGMSTRRYAAKRLSELFGLGFEEGVPPIGDVGRPTVKRKLAAAR